MSAKISVRNERFAYDDTLPFHVIEIFLKPGMEIENIDRLAHHWHSEVEICYCLYSGEHHFMDGQEYLSEPGKLMIVNSGSIHHFELEPFLETEPKRIAILLLVQKDYLKQKFPTVEKFCFSAEGMADPETMRLMQALSRYAMNDDGINTRPDASAPVYSYIEGGLSDWQKIELEGLVLQVLARIVKDRLNRDPKATAPGSAKGQETMKDIIAYIEEHYQEALTQEQLAKEFHYSVSYFSSLFHKNMGETFSHYLADYRARQARFDLLETDESIYSIAIRNGFSDSRRFIIAFRNLYGITPLQYRKGEKNSRKEKHYEQSYL